MRRIVSLLQAQCYKNSLHVRMSLFPLLNVCLCMLPGACRTFLIDWVKMYHENGGHHRHYLFTTETNVSKDKR